MFIEHVGNNNYRKRPRLLQNSIRVELVREGISRDGLEGEFWVQWLLSCIQSHVEYLHRQSVHNLLRQFIPVRGYSNAERMLAATGFTPLLVNLDCEAQSEWRQHKLRRMEIRQGRALFCKYIYSAFANSCPASTESLVADCKVTADSFIVALATAGLGNIALGHRRPQRITINTTR